MKLYNAPMKKMFLLSVLSLTAGCAALFGWNIHAPGLLSGNFDYQIRPLPARVALYLDPSIYTYQSKDRGGATADPQTFYIGEAYAPMALEGFQQAFDEFVFMEVEPTPAIMKQYAISYLAVVRPKAFKNHVTWKGQGVRFTTETAVFNTAFQQVDRFESAGSSDVEKIFAKKGGPEVNLNAALENNVIALVQYIQDAVQTGKWPEV